MSPSLRDFMIISIIGMTLLLGSLLYFYVDLNRDHLQEHLSIHNHNLAVVLRNSLLAQGLGEMLNGAQDRITDEMRARISATLEEELRWVPVVKVKVYGRNSDVLYSTKPTEIGLSARENSGVQSALDGIPVSDLVQRDHVNELDGTIEKLDLHQQYVPVRNAQTGKIDGVFEVYADVSKILEAVDTKQRLVFWSIAAILGGFYLALAFSFLRTHRLMLEEKRQREAHLDELMAIRKDLEERVEQRTADLEKSRKFLQSVIDGIGNPLLVIRPDFTIALMNNAARKLIPSDQPIENYRNCYQISHRQDKPCEAPDHPCSFEKVMKHGRPSRVRHTHFDADNQPIIVDLLSTPLYSETGEFQGVIEVEHDVTQMVKMQAGLVESEARLQAIMDNVPDAIFTCDSDCHIQSLNPSAQKLFRGAVPQLVGKHLTEFFPDDAKEDPVQPNISVQRELQLRRLDGSEFPADVWIGPVDLGNEPSHIAVIRDISSRVQAQRELETTRQQYFHQEKMAAIGQLAAGILHEVGNPIAAIAGAASELKGVTTCRNSPEGDCPFHDAIGRNVDLIDAQTTRLGRITREIADFAAPRPRERELLDLNSLLQSTARLLTYDKRFREVDLRLELDANLPAIVGVADQLTQLFMNLLINAVDACTAIGEEKDCILLKSEQVGDRVLVSVCDSGCGMSEETLMHALEPFYTTKPVGRGTGLGLSLCDSITLSHGGALEIESEQGKGTCVRVFLPIEDDDRASEEGEQ